MPIYEYECDNCGARMELIKKMSDPDPKKCLECGHESLRKLISRSDFHLKGGGWYSDAYDSSEQRSQRNKSEEGLKDGPKEKSKDKDNGKPAKPEASAASESQGSQSSSKKDSGGPTG